MALLKPAWDSVGPWLFRQRLVEAHHLGNLDGRRYSPATVIVVGPGCGHAAAEVVEGHARDVSAVDRHDRRPRLQPVGTGPPWTNEPST